MSSSDSPDHTTPVAESQPQLNYNSITPPLKKHTTTSPEYLTHPQLRTATYDSDFRIHAPRASKTPPMTVPSTFNEQDYLPMGPAACHSLPTVEERSGENCIRLEPNHEKGFGIVYPNTGDSLNRHFDAEEFPKRAYSVGSKSDIQRPKNRHITLDGDDKNDVKSSSAPHLENNNKRLSPSSSSRGSVRSLQSSSPLNRSRRSSRSEVDDEDSELFMEVSFDRVRTGSNASDCVRPRTSNTASSTSSVCNECMRPRTSSWGQAQAHHRPRSNSLAGKLKRTETQINHSRSNSQELAKNLRRPASHLLPNRTGSSESLRKIHFVSPARQHDYAEISDYTGTNSDTKSAASNATTRQIKQLAESMNEMAMQYTEITGQVGIVRQSPGSGTVPWRPPLPSTSITQTSDVDAMDTYFVSEPLNIAKSGSPDFVGPNDGLIPRMVDVWSPQILPGDEDEDEYACLNYPTS